MNPYQSFGGIELYPSIQAKAAQLCFGIVKDHPMIDGNKRLGTHVMLVFLALNGYELSYSQAPNEKWLTDVTEFHYYIGMEKHKVYLSAILDLYDRRIVSYVIRDKNNNALVFDTIDNALLRNPGAQPLFHSDRGFQYTNRTFHTKLVNAGIIQSMSRVAKCIDNGPMEKHEIYLQAA